MSNIINFDGNKGVPANPDDLIAGLQNVTSTIKGSSGGVPFLRLLKSGIWAFGAENIEPEPGSHWAVNPYSIEHGWACWGDGELLDERMVPFNQPVPVKGELPDYGQSWDQQVAMQLRCMNGEDEGVTVLYKGTSTGLRNAVKSLIEDIVTQLQHDKEHLVPVIELETDSYQHKKYGQIFYPVLPIVNWISMTHGVEEEAQAEVEADAEQTQAELDITPVEEPETSEPKKGRRRRRRQ